MFEDYLFTLIFVILVLTGAGIVLFRLSRKSSGNKKKTVSILSSIQISDEDLDTDAEIRELKSRRYRFYRISGFKWILSFLFALVLLFLATFEFWVDYYPVPEVGESYPITLKSAYAFPFHRSQYSPEENIIPRGEVIVKRGETITRSELDLIRSYKENKVYPSASKLLGYFTLFLIFTLFLVFWLLLFFPEASSNANKDLVFIFLAILVVLMVAKFSFLTSLFSMYYIPLAMLAMVVTILIFNRVVPSIIIFTSFFVAIISQFNIQLLLVLFGGGMVTVFWLQRVKKRGQVISAGLAVGVTNLVIFLAIELGRDTYLLWPSVQENAFAALANGVICGFITLLLIPLFEKSFGYLSPFRLMELADLDSDLLRELYFKAPGTYHHSLSVANLAEIAANEIGADALLLRVGAYYHDIGKVFKPKFFVENIEHNQENPHTKISPYASSKILKSHVTLGLELGKKYGLPKKILDLIPQHHGTTVMDYFFDKAKSSVENESLSHQYFSYPGPLPDTKEAAILMVVDSVEAASRVLVDHSEETVRKMIEQIINHKLEQGQLDAAPLTLSDLRKIIYALTKALSSSTHKRIDYPAATGGISSKFKAHTAGEPTDEPEPSPPETDETTTPDLTPAPLQEEHREDAPPSPDGFRLSPPSPADSPGNDTADSPAESRKKKSSRSSRHR